MARIPNVVRRGAIFHFRRAIPAGLLSRLRLQELTCSLRTSCPDAAKVAAHFRRADAFKSLAKNLRHLMRNASAEERKRAFRTGRGL